MEEIGEFQRWGIFFIGIVWGTLEILISFTYFLCEYKPNWCEKAVEKFASCFKIFERKK